MLSLSLFASLFRSVGGLLRAILLIVGLALPVLSVEVMTAAGRLHTTYLADDGTVWAYGYNGRNCMGDGTSTNRTTPVQVLTGPGTPLTGVVAIAAGEYHNLALRQNGTVWAWGYNPFGQVGNGTTTDQPYAVPVLSSGSPITGIKSIAAGANHSMALTADGYVMTWGLNSSGQLGDNTTTMRTQAVSAVGFIIFGTPFPLGNIKAIAAGGTHSLAVTGSGGVRAWGANGSGQLGDNSTTTRLVPVNVVSASGAGTLANVSTVAAGHAHSAAVVNGILHTWGLNTQGQLADGASGGSRLFPVQTGIPVRAIACTRTNTYMQYHYSGYFYGIGDNSFGQLARPTTTTIYTSWQFLAQNVAGFANGCAAEHTQVIFANGVVQACGRNSYGSIGIGSTVDPQAALVTVQAAWPVANITEIASGELHTLARKSDGTVWAWGANSFGQVGDGSTTSRQLPVAVTGASNVITVHSGKDYSRSSYAMRADGTVLAWGDNASGHLGDGTTTSSSVPLQVSGLSNVAAVAAGDYHAVAINVSRQVVSWGRNSSGQLGNGTTIDQTSPVVATGLNGVVAVAAGNSHTMALRADGTVWAWGSNIYGQLGDGTTTQRTTPVQVSTLTEIVAIAAGGYHGMALRVDGTVWTWGYNIYGQIGDGTTTNRLAPVQALNPDTTVLTNVKDLAGGALTSYAIMANGTMRTWGWNSNYQFGNGGNTNSSYAVNVSALSSAMRCDGGYLQAAAVTADGRVFSWGNNGSGQIGNGTYDTAIVPTLTTREWLPQVGLSIISAAGSESGPTAAIFRFTRTLSTAGALPVSYSVSGTATAGSDYTALPGLAIIPAGSSFINVTMTPIDDFVDEVDDLETVVPLTTTNVDRYRMGVPNSGVMSILDNDVAGVAFSAASGTTYESDDNTIARTFQVRLNSRPLNNVTLTFGSSNTNEGRVDANITAGNQNQASLVIIPNNWNVWQTVEVYGRQDFFADGDIPYTISTTTASTDGKYQGLALGALNWTNVDDEVVAVVVDASFDTVTEAAGAGNSATFNIRLTSQPYNPVSFALSSSDLEEGRLQTGDETKILNASNWQAGVTVTVLGVDDDIDDGNQSFSIAIQPSVSADSAYHNLGPWSVLGSCLDDDTKGVQISPTTVNVTEGGAKDAFSAVLTSEPVGGSVTVTFAGDVQVVVDTDGGVVGDQTSVVFTSANWSTPRVVEVRAVDDALIEGAHGGTVTGSVSGADYSTGVTVADVSCVITDNDGPGVTVAPSTTTVSRQVTAEPDGTAAFTVRLQTQPIPGETVTIRLNSDDVSEGLVAGTVNLTTASADNGTSRFLFLPGTDLSAVVVGASVMVEAGATENQGRRYWVTAVDDPGDAITVSSISGIIGTTATDENLIIGLPQTLTFSNVNWNVPQSVTVTGQDDAATDGDQPYAVHFTVVDTGSFDADYSGLAIDPQYFVNQDNDVPGIAVVQSGGSTVVDESDLTASGQDTFTVRLNTEPTAGNLVFVAIATDGQTIVDKTTLVFTQTGGAAPWNVAQTVTVTAIDDYVDEASPHASTIGFTVTSGDGAYDGIAATPVIAQVADDDTADILVSPTSGLFTTEGAQTAAFSVVLASRPTHTVTIPISSSDAGEGTVSAAQLVFSTANWNVPQSITVTGVDDDLDDGDVAYVIVTGTATSTDPRYAVINPPNVVVMNQDNDAAAVVITLSGGSTDVVENGATDTYEVRLATEPTADVQISISGGTQATVNPTVLTFTSLNWATNQQVTVTAVDDDIAEGLHAATVSHVANGGGYAGVAIANVNVAITDNDAADVTLTLPGGGVVTREDGTTDQFSIRLESRPLANVTVVLTVDDATEGIVTPSSLTFTPSDFSVDQAVTVTGLNDSVADGDITYPISVVLVSADTNYNALAVADVNVTNEDDDVAGYQVSAISDSTTESGGQATFTVRLTSQPTATVTIGVSSSDPGEGEPSVASIIFTPSNWNDLAYVTVTGVDDFSADGDIGYQIDLTGDGATTDTSGYLALAAGNVAVQNIDDDIVGILVSTPTITLAESGGPVSFAVVLRSEPLDDVTVPMVCSDISEAELSVASLVFTTANWDEPQTVIVTPVDDELVDGDVDFTITIGPSSSGGDAAYDGISGTTINGITQDDDQAAIQLSAVSGTTTEAGGTSDFTVVLTSQPTDPVTITVTGLDVGEGSLSTATITFLPASAPTIGAWDTPQTITVTGVDDFVDDGDIVYALTLTPTSDDATYQGLSPRTYTVTNTDDDAAGVQIVESSGSTIVDEAGIDDTYTIALASQPLGVVTITVTPDSQVEVNGSGAAIVLTFDPAEVSPAATGWNTVRTITVSAVPDTFDESDPHSATITHNVSGYGGVTAQPITVTVIDNNPPTVVANAGLTLARASSAVITDVMLSFTDVETAQRDLVFNLVLAPGQGTLLRNGVTLANGGSFTMGDIEDGLITYQNGGTPNTADGFAFRVRDDVGNQSDLTIFNIVITGFIPPQIVFSGNTPTYVENAGPTAIDSGITVSDPDSVYYDLLTVSLAVSEADDELFIAPGGVITLAGATINFSGSPIGSWLGGTAGDPLIVTFSSSAAGDDEVREVLTSLRYRNVSEAPVSGVREIEFVLRDETGTENVAAVKDLTVFAVNDPPTIADATLITPKNVAIASALTVEDIDSYPLTLTVVTPPGKGVLSGAIIVGTPTVLNGPGDSRAFIYSPLTGQEGADSFEVEVEDADGATAQATINVLIVGGAAARPWIVSDPPIEAEAGAPLSYDIEVDFGDLAMPPDPGDVTYSLVGTLPAGVTFGAFTPNGINATLTLTVAPGATGVIAVGIVVTETANNTTGYQPITIAIVPAGSLGG